MFRVSFTALNRDWSESCSSLVKTSTFGGFGGGMSGELTSLLARKLPGDATPRKGNWEEKKMLSDDYSLNEENWWLGVSFSARLRVDCTHQKVRWRLEGYAANSKEKHLLISSFSALTDSLLTQPYSQQTITQDPATQPRSSGVFTSS